MLFHLSILLSDTISFFNVFRYISFRSIYALLTAFALGLALMPPFIRYMRRRHLSQALREDGPKQHLVSKAGTPTMGGGVILTSAVVSTLLWANLQSQFVWGGIGTLLVLGGLGLADDIWKVKARSSKGVPGKAKLLIQGLWGAGVGVWLAQMPEVGTLLQLPFFKHVQPLLGASFFLFAALVVMASSNAVNLTDGLDGLVSVPLVFAFLTYLGLVYCAGNKLLAAYLNVAHVPGSGEVCILIGALMGAIVAFLWYNTYPAQVFMGDVGSLSLGGALGYVALIAKQEVLLILVGGLFVVEALSVIFQVASFKLRGKRIFRMAPLHHHFELLGWPEPRVIVRFWILSGIFALLAISTLKLR